MEAEIIEFKFSKQDNQDCTIVAVGDLMLARDVDKVAKKNGVESFFSNVGNVLKRADISFCNLESVITKSTNPSPYSRSNFKIDPDYTRTIGEFFDVAAVANNHTYDFGIEGLKDTVSNLKGEGVYALGLVQENSTQPIIIEKNGMTIAFLGYMCLPTIEEYEKLFPIAKYEESLVKADIENVKSKADICIVSMHGGHELVDYVAPDFKKMCRFAIDNGADMVIGHHTHVIAGIENYNNKPIAYGMGNFIFDNATIPKRKESFILKANIAKNFGVKSIELFPIIIDDSYTPKFASDDAYERIKGRIEHLNECIEKGTNDDKYWELASSDFLGKSKRNLLSTYRKMGFKGIWIMVKRLRIKHFYLLIKSIAKRQ